MNLTTGNEFARRLADRGLPLRHTRTQVLQVNVGKLCNLTCVHCHVNAGPKRKEIITRETVDRVVDWLAQTDIPTVDLTGGAPDGEELYCPAVEWDWGDETRSESTSDCDPYEEGKSEIKRRFVVEHIFQRAGSYKIYIRLKRRNKSVVAATTTVQIRPGAREF